MASDHEAFEISGPTYLSHVDWTSPQHRRSVAASLVQGAYSMEHDRHRSHALAAPWWSFFHFQLIEPLIDDADQSIFGAIYEYRPPFQVNSVLIEHAPRFVVAFRGTITDERAVFRDLKLNFDVFTHCLQKSSRCDIAIQAVQHVVSIARDPSKIWLAGHSLGASVATVVGKRFAQTGVLLESFLFSPPFLTAPLEIIKNEKVKKGVRFIGSMIKTGFALLKEDEGSRSGDSFERLSSWIPHLFVNPRDQISVEYIGYFEDKQLMEEIGAVTIGRLAARQSIRATILEAFGKECDRVHLLPSANLIVNKSSTGSLRRAHGIDQWWRPDMDLNEKQYMY